MEHSQVHFASSHNQKKDNNQFKRKKQPELPENQTVWKSDNQGVKEETFIQAGRRGGDGQPGGEDSQQGSGLGVQSAGWWTGGFHISVQISQEEKMGCETDHTTQGSNTGN